MSLRPRIEALHVFNTAAGGTAPGTIPLVTGVAGQRISVYRLIITFTAVASTAQFNGSVSGAISQAFQIASNGAITIDTPINNDPWWQTAAGEDLRLVTTGGNVSYDIWYLQGV